MISRKSTKLLAELYEYEFTETTTIKLSDFSDFLYERDYSPEFMQTAKQALRTLVRPVDFIKQIHTGESLNQMTINWNSTDKIELGQNLLKKLAEDIINIYEDKKPNIITILPGEKNDTSLETIKMLNKRIIKPFTMIGSLKKQLELDGYIYRDGVLYFSESSVIKEKEEQSYLQLLINSLPLNNKIIILNHLDLSEEHYLNGKWGDSISNSRNFLEAILDNVAQYIHTKKHLVTKTPDRAVKVRDFLEEQGFINAKEKEAIYRMYGLVSETGAHPNMAEQDEARLMRHLCLTFSQYILLTFETYLKNNS